MRSLLLSFLFLLPLLLLGAALPNVGAPPAAAQEPDPGQEPGQGEELLAYEMIDQWPERSEAAAGLFTNPYDLDVAPDGTVLVADRGVGGVHRLLPTGVFSTPFGAAGGFPAQLGQVGAISIGPETAEGAGPRVYVVDSAVDRVVVYDLVGNYLAQWEGITAQSLVASSDGRVYVLDREESVVRALAAQSGAEIFRFGARGTAAGQFSNFTDVDVSDDGRVLAVSDLRGLRLQVWELADDAALAGGAAPVSPSELVDFTESKYNKEDMVCRASRINVLGAERFFVGEREQACILDGRDVSAAIATSANSGTICRATVRLPHLRSDGAQFFAIATYDANLGKCGEKRTDLDTTTVVARYNDDTLRGVRTVWEAAATDDVDARLFSPQELSMPAPDRIFVRDNSPVLRYYDTDGQELSSIARDSSARDNSTDFETTRLREMTGSESLEEIYAYYFKIRRQNDQTEVEQGIGRFVSAEKRTQQGVEAVIEPVWTRPYSSSSGTTSNVNQMAYNPVSGELLALQTDSVAAQRTLDVKIVRFSPDGRELDPAFDLPDDGELDPYIDLSVGPDGRIYVLDTLGSKVLVYGADGSAQGEVRVARDAKGVAGGPAGDPLGSVFILRERGAIERYADDGTVTARLDGRALPFSDPTFISDMVVDIEGLVYVADGQASLVSVFRSTDDTYVLPVPDDGTCAFLGIKTAAPERIMLGETVGIDLSLSGSCGLREDPTDIVVVLPYLGELRRGRDLSAVIISNMLSLAARVDFDQHRVGIVSYYQTTTVELPLTHDREAYIEAVQDLTRMDPPNDNIKPRLRDAMEEANELYEPAEGNRQVMVLLSAAYCDPNDQRRPRDCTGYPPAEEIAQQVRDEGTRIIAVFGGAAANLASSDEDVVNDFGTAHRRMVDYRLPKVLMRSLELSDTLPGNMALVPGSITEGGSWNAPAVTWQASDLGFDGVSVRFEIEPLEAGVWPTNVEAVAEIVDGWGASQRVVFPIPRVEVIGPTPEPSDTPAVPPTATPAPPSATPADTSSTVYLPTLMKGFCRPKHVRLDLVLVVDVSDSMKGEKLEAAKAAIGGFLGAANLGENADHAALIDFASEARVHQGLSADRAALEASVDALESRSGTRIDKGLEAALGLLTAAEERGAQPVVLLLSDGQQTDGQGLDEALAAGAALRALGAEVYAVGLGADVDEALLRDLVSGPGFYLPAAGASDLEGVYAAIAAGLTGCP